MESTISTDIVVFYHGNCLDGFGAAWAAWKKLGNQASYISQVYGAHFPREIRNKEVYLVDFTHSFKEMEWLKENNLSVTSIDHHKSKEEDSKISTHRIFDLNHSGAVLAWSFFHPNTSMPALLGYLEDFDLWLFRKSDTGAVVRYIAAQGLNFEAWDRAVSDLENSVKRAAIIDKGNLILHFENNIYDEIEKDAFLVSFEGREILVANAPHWFASHLGDRLYKKKPPMAITWRETKDGIHLSFRSDGSVDVSEIAKRYSADGGGHRGSAGANLPSGAPLPWVRINKNHEDN